MDQAALDQLTAIYNSLEQVKLLMPLYMDYTFMLIGIIYGGLMAIITASELKALR